MSTIINDIRISDLSELRVRLNEDFPVPWDLFSLPYYRVSKRYNLLLRSLKFETGPGDVYSLEIEFDIPHSEVKPQWEGLCCIYSCGLDVDQFKKYDEWQRQVFFIRAIHAVVDHIARREGLDTAKNDLAYEQMMVCGDKLQIVQLSKSTKTYELTVLFTVEETSQLILRVFDKASKQSGSFALLELDDFYDATKLASRLTVKEDCVIVHPRQTDLGFAILRRYWERLDSRGYHKDRANYIEVHFKIST